MWEEERNELEFYMMGMAGETPDPANFPRRPLEYYLMLLVGESPDINNLPRLPLEYYLMLLIGESPDISNLPRRPLEYYLMLLRAESPDIANLPLRLLEYYFGPLEPVVGVQDILFNIDSNGDLIGDSKAGIEPQFNIVSGDFNYLGSDPQFDSASINSSGYLIGA